MNRRSAVARIAALFGAGVAAPLVKLAEVDAETVGYSCTESPSLSGTLTTTTTGTFSSNGSTSSMIVWVNGTKYGLPLFR